MTTGVCQALDGMPSTPWRTSCTCLNATSTGQENQVPRDWGGAEAAAAPGIALRRARLRAAA